MAVSDAVVRNLTVIYLAVIAAVKLYGLVAGRSLTGTFVLVTSTAVVGLVLVVTLTWDVCRKATHAVNVPRDQNHREEHEMCRGGICLHGI